MNVFLSERNTELNEIMDDPNCDVDLLYNTYRQFRTINRLLSRWNAIYKSEILPALKPSGHNTLLDIGFGGGDIPLKLARWAQNDGFNLQVIAIDPDPRAFDYVSHLDTPNNIEFLQCGIDDIDSNRQQFDFVISNHLMHHLKNDELLTILNQAKKLSRGRILFNDIRRDDIGYLLFNVIPRPFFRNSFVVEDGLQSIKRSFTPKELSKLVPQDFTVKNIFPFRILLAHYG